MHNSVESSLLNWGIFKATAPAYKLSSRLILSFQPAQNRTISFFFSFKYLTTAVKLRKDPMITSFAFDDISIHFVPLVVVRTTVLSLTCSFL